MSRFDEIMRMPLPRLVHAGDQIVRAPDGTITVIRAGSTPSPELYAAEESAAGGDRRSDQTGLRTDLKPGKEAIAARSPSTTHGTAQRPMSPEEQAVFERGNAAIRSAIARPADKVAAATARANELAARWGFPEVK